MDPLTIIAIARAAMAGVQEAIAVWPTIERMFASDYQPLPHELDAINIAADISHDALQK